MWKMLRVGIFRVISLVRPPKILLRHYSSSEVEVETRGLVRIIALNRPDSRNAVNQRTAGQLYQAFRDFDSDSNVNVAVLHGVGGTFCAGYDLKELATMEETFDLLAEKVGKGPAPMVSTHPFY